MSVSIILPQEVEITNHLEWIENYLSGNNKVKLREFLFFDELVTGFVVFKCSDETIRDNAKIQLDVSVANAELLSYDNEDAERENEGSNVSIMNWTLDETDVISKKYHDKEHCTIWKFTCPIVYPKRKLNKPNVLLSCYVHREVSEESPKKEKGAQNDFLVDFEPIHGANILDELSLLVSSTRQQHTSFKQPSAQRKVNETQTTRSPTVFSSYNMHIPLLTCLDIKLKSTKPAGRNNVMLATLGLELSEELLTTYQNTFPYFLSIKELQISLTEGEVKNQDHVKTFPIDFKLRDSLSLTYKLSIDKILDSKNLDRNIGVNLYIKAINLRIVIQLRKVVVEGGSYSSVPVSSDIIMNWSPSLDFSLSAPPINNCLKTTSTNSPSLSQVNYQSLKVPRKPNFYKTKNALSGSLLAGSPALTSTNLTQPSKKLGFPPLKSASSVMVNLTTGNSSTLSGLKLTFQGKLTLKLGEITTWRLQAINNSTYRLNLSLLAQNSSNSNSQKAFNAYASAANSTDKIQDKFTIYNRSLLFNAYQSMKAKMSGVLTLDNDIRIGPIDPGNVYETTIRLIGISPGIYNLDGIKLFDVGSGDGLDFGKLVEVFVV